MEKFKIKRGWRTKPLNTTIENWTGDHLSLYFRKKFKKIYGVETNRPIGQIKLSVNKKSVSLLYRIEGRSPEIYPNELFCEFINWRLENRKLVDFRIMDFRRQEIMADFLDIRAKKQLDVELGTIQDMEVQELERKNKAIEYYRGQGIDI